MKLTFQNYVVFSLNLAVSLFGPGVMGTFFA